MANRLRDVAEKHQWTDVADTADRLFEALQTDFALDAILLTTADLLEQCHGKQSELLDRESAECRAKVA